MNLKLRAIEGSEAARPFLPLIEEGIRASSLAYSEEAVPPGAGERFLAERFGRPESLLLIAEGDAGPLALAITGPFEDPVTGESVPILIALYVDASVRHRGIARALVREVRRLLAERGYATLTARAGHNDDAIISMGERWGMVRTWEMMAVE